MCRREGRTFIQPSHQTTVSTHTHTHMHMHTHTHTHARVRARVHFTALWTLSRTTQVSRYQKGKATLDFTEARDSEWQWHQLGHMQIFTSLQTDNDVSITPLTSPQLTQQSNFFTV